MLSLEAERRMKTKLGLLSSRLQADFPFALRPIHPLHDREFWQ
jgi:hypothetical protein